MLEVVEKGIGRTAKYKLTSTVMLWLQTDLGAGGSGAQGQMHLGGSMTRQQDSDAPIVDDRAHIVKIGQMIEACSRSRS